MTAGNEFSRGQYLGRSDIMPELGEFQSQFRPQDGLEQSILDVEITLKFMEEL
jgi:hypothetical protein